MVMPMKVAITQWAGLLIAGFYLAGYLCSAVAQSTNMVPELLRQLGAESCAVRDQAETQLRALGPDILPVLEAHRNSRDPEIKLRIGRLLQGVAPSVRQFLERKGKCTGFADEGEKHWPCVVEVKEFDAATGAFAGTVEWTSLAALHAIEGKLEADKLVFRETKIIRRGNAVLDCVYTLGAKPADADKPGRLTGNWKDPNNGRGGNVELDLNASVKVE